MVLLTEVKALNAIYFNTKLPGILREEVLAKANLAGANYLKKRVEENTPLGPSLNLISSVKAKAHEAEFNINGKKVKIKEGSSVVYLKVGTGGAHHAHLVVLGHEIYVRGKRLVPVRRTKANPFLTEHIQGN